MYHPSKFSEVKTIKNLDITPVKTLTMLTGRQCRGSRSTEGSENYTCIRMLLSLNFYLYFQEPKIDREVVDLLERLSLVEFNNQEGVDRLTKAVHSANLLHAVNTNNVEPMDSVLEDR